MLRINISSLDPGIHHIELKPDPLDIDLDPDKFGNIRVNIRLDVFLGRILVMFDTSATAVLECDRTLQLFNQEIEGTYTLLFASSAVAGEHEGVNHEEIRVLHSEDREIDLTAVVRDTLVLAIPQRAVAPGVEELEIKTKFGIPEDQSDVDPRWEALLKLRTDVNESK